MQGGQDNGNIQGKTSMKWKKYTIHTTTEAEDYLSAMLDELGIQGVEIENKVPLTKSEQSDMFIDFPPELMPDDGKSLVSFYLEYGEDHSDLLKKVEEGIERQREFVDVGEGFLSEGETEDADWMNNWKQFFHSFCIGGIVIKPTWEELKDEDRDKLLIEIDPGISFGTGKHETTQLCIRQLSKYVKDGMKVLDAGCGSGILSIAALKLGAAFATGTDLDENCIASSEENMRVNRLPKEAAVFYKGNLIDDDALREKAGKRSYDLVVANILADVIIPMAPALHEMLKSGGILITSGIIDFKECEVRAAVEAAGFSILETNRQGEWVGITAAKE